MKTEEKAEEWVKELSGDVDKRIANGYGYVTGPDFDDIRDAYLAGYTAGFKAGEEHLSTWSRKVTSELIADAMRPKKEGG